MFYGLLRLLPDGPLRDGVSFSTFEPNPDAICTTLSATVFHDPAANLSRRKPCGRRARCSTPSRTAPRRRVRPCSGNPSRQPDRVARPPLCPLDRCPPGADGLAGRGNHAGRPPRMRRRGRRRAPAVGRRRPSVAGTLGTQAVGRARRRLAASPRGWPAICGKCFAGN